MKDEEPEFMCTLIRKILSKETGKTRTSAATSVSDSHRSYQHRHRTASCPPKAPAVPGACLRAEGRSRLETTAALACARPASSPHSGFRLEVGRTSHGLAVSGEIGVLCRERGGGGLFEEEGIPR